MARGGASLTREHWADAALDALASGGPRAVAVEPLARALGVTKGSFYHHFSGREELLEVALHRWETLGTDGLLELDALAPRERLEALFASAMDGQVEPRWAVLVTLAAHPEVPIMRTTLHRVMAHRLAYLTRAWSAAGFEAPEAEMRATLAFSSYLGMVQLAVSAPDLAPRGEARRALVRRVLELLVPPER